MLLSPLAAEEKILKGIVLLGKNEECLSKEELSEIEGVFAFDIPPTKGTFYLNADLCEQYIEKPWNMETLEAIKETISDYYVKQGNPFVLITIPEQNITQNIVQIHILQAKLGKLEFEGNTWTPTKTLEKYLSLPSGCPISMRAVEKNLNFFNRNPFRRASVIYGPGKETGEADMTVVVQEKARSFRLIAGFENNGVYEIERERWFTGFSSARFLGSESFFTFQYISAYDLRLFQAYTGQWQMFLPWKHELNLYGGYSTVRNANLITPGAFNGGRVAQGSLRYTIPLPWSLGMQSDFFFGADWKNMNSFIEFGDYFENFHDDLAIFDIAAGVSYFLSRKPTELRGRVEALASPGQWLPNQTSSRYNLARFGATNYWIRVRGDTEILFFLPSFTFRFYLEGQYSNFVLMPSEQMGLGGYGSVRGYTERQLNADTGLVGSFEWRGPHFPVISVLKGRKVQDGLQLLAFTDYGFSILNRIFGDQPRLNYLWSFGAGVRYTLNDYLTGRFDWGYKLHLDSSSAPDFFGPRNLIHFSVILSFP